MRKSRRASGVRASAILQTRCRPTSRSASTSSRCLRRCIEAISGGPALLPPGHFPEEQLVAAGGKEGMVLPPHPSSSVYSHPADCLPVDVLLTSLHSSRLRPIILPPEGGHDGEACGPTGR